MFKFCGLLTISRVITLIMIIIVGCCGPCFQAGLLVVAHIGFILILHVSFRFTGDRTFYFIVVKIQL